MHVRGGCQHGSPAEQLLAAAAVFLTGVPFARPPLPACPCLLSVLLPASPACPVPCLLVLTPLLPLSAPLPARLPADSIEDKILELQQRKRAVIASAFSGAGAGGASNMAEVMELFSDIL